MHDPLTNLLLAGRENPKGLSRIPRHATREVVGEYQGHRADLAATVRGEKPAVKADVTEAEGVEILRAKAEAAEAFLDRANAALAKHDTLSPDDDEVGYSLADDEDDELYD